ncbi:hypothetical protein N24_3008 [Corynebacterium suranareeae]|uniref:Secreted protein n=1 Tax=Corynebacterium suranareeae TaxID=2506452 RepID=A0A169S864_9CORY|nr:hypothetical protein [Corynebacterium suranareeae]BAU97270.1 hypothetical protein N24_3008 [Corynebacterium suranareeae]
MKKHLMIPAALLIGSLALVSCAPTPATQNVETVSAAMTDTPTYTSSSRSVESTAGTVAATEEAALTLQANSPGVPGAGGTRYSFNSLTVSEQAAASAVLKALLNDASSQHFAHPSYLDISGTPSADNTWGVSFSGDAGSASAIFSGGGVEISAVDMPLSADSLPQMNSFYSSLTQEQLDGLESGIAVSSLSAGQQDVLLDMVATSVGLADSETTDTMITKIRDSLSDTYLFGTADELSISGPEVDFEVSRQGSALKVTYRDPSTDSLIAEERVDISGVAAAPPEVV